MDELNQKPGADYAGWNAASMTEMVPRAQSVAIVHSRDGVHLVATGPEEAAFAQVGEYVRSRAEHQLWPHQAAQLQELLAQGRVRDAVEFYFARVGDRWDQEYLVVRPAESSTAA